MPIRTAPSDTQGRQRERSMKLSFSGKVPIQWRKHCSAGAPPDFQANEYRRREYQKHHEKGEERSVYGENRGSKDAGKGQHGKEQSIAVIGHAVKSHDGDKQQKMHHGE